MTPLAPEKIVEDHAPLGISSDVGREPEKVPELPPGGPSRAPPPAAPPRFYLPELDGLRCFAFALVFLFHQGVPWPTLASLIGSGAARCFRENGWVGVQLFFILSGYLITSLLLREESKYGYVDLKAFWVRRILRIWPLYYLVVVIAFLIIPACNGSFSTAAGRSASLSHLPWFLLFVGNWSMIVMGPVHHDAQSVLWSVCVEEQFYLAVPLIVALVKPRWRAPLVLAGIAAAVGARAWLAGRDVHQLMIQYNTFAQADTLLSGVLLALVLRGDVPKGRAERLLRLGCLPVLAGVVWVFTRGHLGHGEAWRRTWDFLAIWLSGCGIVAIATVPGWVRAALRYRRLVWLGQISYGLYMFHEVAFWIRASLDRWLGWFPNKEPLLAIAALAMTIGMAWLSYGRFERPFLKLKARWTRLPSRPL